MSVEHNIKGMIINELHRFPRSEVMDYFPLGHKYLTYLSPERVDLVDKSGLNSGMIENLLTEEEQEMVYNMLRCTPTPLFDTGEVKDEVYESSYKTGVFIGEEDVPLCEILRYTKGEDVAFMHNSHYNGRSVLTVYKLKSGEDKKKAVEELRAIAKELLNQAEELENETEN